MIWWIFATVIAFFIKGLCGFANTLIFQSILSFTDNNVNISPVELILGYPTNAILTLKERKSIRWNVCLPLSALVLCGCIPGIFLLKNADTSFLKVIFGFVIIGIGIEMLLREYLPQKKEQSRLILLLVGILSGLLCGLYGIGALLSAYVGRVTKDIHAFKANMCFVFFVENTFRIILYIAWGVIRLESLKTALMLAPFMLGGLFLGMKSGMLLDERKVKKLVILLLILSGVTLILNNIH